MIFPLLSFHSQIELFEHQELLLILIMFVCTRMMGSISDIICLMKSGLWQRLNYGGIGGGLFFDGQYILRDLGHVNQPHIVTCFKRFDTSHDKTNFNTFMEKAQVTNEHCIGVLKS